jgi:hypothetical protein
MDGEWPSRPIEPEKLYVAVTSGHGDEARDSREAVMDMLIRIDHKLNCIWAKMTSPSDGV